MYFIKILFVEVLRKNNDLKQKFEKGLDETNKNLNNSFIEMKKAYDLKIKNYVNIFDAKIMQNDESNKRNIDKLNLINPYPPSFKRIPARITDPSVGAST